ncbi:MAG TPA: ABC transporter ATP-binding protein [Clostridiaceae bacterium]|nr:ABC transporter ATP-binding protein [Clostridiaceae bacterium]
MKDKFDTGTLRKVFQYIKHYRFLLLGSIILAAVTVAMTLYIPILIGRAIDFIIGKADVNFQAVLKILLQIGIIASVTALLQWVMNIINNKITFHVIRDIRDEAFKKIQILPLKFLDKHPHGEIVSRLISDTDQFAEGLLMGFTQLFTGITTIIGTFLFMLSINWIITAVVVILTPLSLLVASFIANRTYNMFKIQSEIRAKQTSFINEMISNQKVVQAFSREAKTLEEFDKVNEKLEKSSLRAIFYSSLTNPSTRFINNVIYAGVGLTGALAAVGGSISVGGLTSFLSYANQYTKPFNEISGVITEFQNALACASRIFDLIEEEPQVPDSDDAIILKIASGKVDLNNVEFSYTIDRKLIKNLNLNVKPGQRVAIIGPTGSGKTTIINLLMRFYDVNDGSIEMDDIDIRDITRRSLRRNFGMVLQETWLKSGTIRDNIVIGKSDATETEIIEAAKASHAHSFIKRLPYGYDTIIGEDGGSLSQGEKQLLCIARVMLALPPVLILDEATSSIDTRTELKIQEAFAKMMKGRTSFIVAHRLSTIVEADTILVLKNGSIIEQGNHRELLNKNGFYARLYNSQFTV